MTVSGRRVNGVPTRGNMTVWRSVDSGATWSAIEQVEKGNLSLLSQLHLAYSALLPAPDREEEGAGEGGGAAGASGDHGVGGGAAAGYGRGYGLVYERGPMGGSHVVPSRCGEYASIRWHRSY